MTWLLNQISKRVLINNSWMRNSKCLMKKHITLGRHVLLCVFTQLLCTQVIRRSSWQHCKVQNPCLSWKFHYHKYKEQSWTEVERNRSKKVHINSTISVATIFHSISCRCKNAHVWWWFIKYRVSMDYHYHKFLE